MVYQTLGPQPREGHQSEQQSAINLKHNIFKSHQHFIVNIYLLQHFAESHIEATFV